MKIDLFHNELPFLVLLRELIGFRVGPSNQGLATFAKNITDAVEAGHQSAILGRPDIDIDTVFKQISSSMTTMTALGNDFIVTSQVGATVGTSINLGAFQKAQ